MRLLNMHSWTAIALSLSMKGAFAATFSITPITVSGSNDVDAEAINDSGAIAGTVYLGSSSYGFVKMGKTVTPIAGDCDLGSCVGYATSINNSGVVTGMLGAKPYGFVWQGGIFKKGQLFPYQSSPYLYQPEWPKINDKGQVAYTQAPQNSASVYTGFMGVPPNVKQVSGFGLTQNNTRITGLNNAGYLTGITVVPTSGNIGSAFIGKGHVYDDLILSVSPLSAVVANVSGEIAGGAGSLAWTVLGSTLTTVQMPVQAQNVTVQAINKHGRIAGTFLDVAANVQRGFLYNGSTVSSFGSFGPHDDLHISLNNHETIVVSDYTPQPTIIWSSYRVTCSGTGC